MLEKWKRWENHIYLIAIFISIGRAESCETKPKGVFAEAPHSRPGRNGPLLYHYGCLIDYIVCLFLVAVKVASIMRVLGIDNLLRANSCLESMFKTKLSMKVPSERSKVSE